MSRCDFIVVNMPTTEARSGKESVKVGASLVEVLVPFCVESIFNFESSEKQ